jgi:quercetin dioxygenase-like cupin family protein
MKSVRRLVTVDDASGKSSAIADGAAPQLPPDPAQPGAVSSFVWSTDRTPARVSTQAPEVPRTIAPPPGGSLCRIITFPPDIGRTPMRKSRTLDFCLVLEGEITLVLDLEEVALKQGDVVVQRASRHAWSNRSGRPCVVAISSHDATENGR